MADKPDGKLLHANQKDDLSMTGKPVLVQNNLGIFYGFLEKSDTRSGTALLRDGFKLSPDRHITFSQYLDFLSNEMSDRYWAADEEYMEAWTASDDDHSLDINPEEFLPTEKSIIPNEILINQGSFREHARDLAITDYASEGIFLVQKRTSTHVNSKHVQSSAPLVSVTNVVAIVAISEQVIEHPGMEAIKKDIEEHGHINEAGRYYDALTPLMTFGLVSIDPFIMKLYSRLKDEPSLKVTADEFFSQFTETNPRVTRSLSYIMMSIPKQVESYINKDLIKNNEDLRKFTLEYVDTIANLPALVVNSSQRVSDYQKKAQIDEQAQ